MEIRKLDEVARLLNVLAPSAIPVVGMSIDSRSIKAGELYWALKGEKVDGHSFLGDVKSKGACGAVVSKSYQGPDFGLPLLRVEDPLHALQECARQIIARRHVRIVAVTGSVGKTSTKEFLKTLLGLKYHVAASPGNSNSQVGLPLTILNQTTGKEEILVLEMGMTHPGHISRLVQIAPPEVAVITTVALVHACNFNAIEDIAWAKAEIFSQSSTRLGVLPLDISNYSEISVLGRCRKISFSTTNSQADYSVNHQHHIHAKLENQDIAIDPSKLPSGKHNLHNFLAAAVVARHFNIEWEEIVAAIPLLQLPERRLQFIHHKDICFLNDSYNATEVSVKAALETLPTPEKTGSKIAVLGSMMELGKFSEDCHARVGEHALNYVEGVFCLGEECRPIYDIFKKAGKPTELFLNRVQLVDHLRKILKPSDVVLLKGSRSKEMWKILEEL